MATKRHKVGKGKRHAPSTGPYVVSFQHGNDKYLERHKTLRAAVADAAQVRARTGGYVVVTKDGYEVAEVGPSGVKIKRGRGFIGGGGWDSVRAQA